MRDCNRIFNILMYDTRDWKPGNSKADYVNHTRTRRENISSETNHETHRRHLVLKY
jgi:hypothetical protein